MPLAHTEFTVKRRSNDHGREAGAAVGFSRKRLGKDGRPSYTAYYCDIKDRERSAGTFTNKKDAAKARQRAEAKVAEGRLGDPGRGRQTFQDYVEKIWLPNHEIEAPPGRVTPTPSTST